ncbi:MAG: Ig-like domain-containing protein [Methanobacterium paludis]|nr:Ig-like domain-containing protein [Methanobacterium paludis]
MQCDLIVNIIYEFSIILYKNNTMEGFIINGKSYFALVFMFGLALFLTISGVSAVTWTVNPGENIQSVINNASSNDTIVVNDNNGSAYTYTGNLVVNKTLSLKAKQDGLVAIQATNSSKPVITINLLGNDTKIQGFIIKGATNSDGIYLNGTSGCNITENSLTNNLYGIYLDTSLNSTISMNTIINNTNSGICLNDSSATVKFNRITGNSKYGLYNIGNGVVNSTNNWWGTNTPIMSANSTSDICAAGGTVTYNPWLVLNMTADPGSTNGNSSVTVDLTHNNNGEDTSYSGNVPDDIPINFTTDVGTINSTFNTKNGKTNTIFNSGASTSGTAKITTSLDRQTVQTNVNIDKTAPTIVSSDPKNNEIEVPGNKVIKTTFSESVKVGTNWIELADGNGTMVPITTSICGNVLTVTPAVFLTNGTRYALLIHTGSLKDLAGNNVAGYVTRFNTDSMAPVITGSDPVRNAVNVPINEIIKVTFNEPIKTGTDWIELVDSNGAMVPITTVIGSNTLTITPQNLLIDGRKYSVLIHTGSLKDLAGNNVAAYVTSFATGGIIDTAERVKTYIETNHCLPSSVTISGIQVNMPQFLQLSAKTVLNINNDVNTPIVLGNVGSAPNPAETMTNGIFNSTEYLNIANRVNSFINSNGKAPNYATSSLGNMRYESLVYMYSQILSSYNNNNVLPGFIKVNSWAVVSNSNTVFYSVDQVNDAASRVKAYVEANHRLPNYVTMSGKQVTMPQFLQLSTTTLLNIEGNFDASTALQSYGSAPNPAETIKSKNMGQVEYVNIACNVQTFMDVFGKAPNYATSSLGNIRYESLVYTYSQLLNYYSLNNYLPENVAVDPWSVVSNSNTIFYSADQVNDAADQVKVYVEVNHRLPNYVTMSGKQVNMPQFLQLSNAELLNISGTLCTSFISRSYGAAPAPSETAKNGNLNSTEYLDIANRVNSFMNSNSLAPNYATSSLGNIRYESLIYMNSQILSSYGSFNGTLPDYITLNPWTVVSNLNMVFIGMDQVNNASGTVKSYVETNHQLPNCVTISGKQVTMPQFLQLLTTALLNRESNLNTSIVLESIGNATNSTEDITSGDIQYSEYIDIAKDAKKFMDSNGTAPNYAYQTSLGSHIGFASLVYMYSQIMNSYNINNTLPDYVTVTPWIAVSNPNAIYNYQSNEIFNSIQAAIDDLDTLNSETIGLGIGTILENVIVNKELTIMSIPTVNVTVQAANPNLPVFTITTNGSGSIIQDLVIQGSTNNAGIYINNSFYNTISDDIISCNNNGIYVDNATDNQIADSNILNNTLNGIFIGTGSDNNTIAGNTLTNNGYGIRINGSINNTVSNNILSNNNLDGINLNNSSADINFNKIVVNSRYGLYNEGNGTVDATNNWWGSNTPKISSNDPSDICTAGGTVNCDPWLVLNVTSSCDRSNTNGTCYNYIITADLTKNNHGKDTTSGDGPSSGNTLPDGIPINFNTTFGNISTPVSTRSGKSVVIISSSTAGLANVSAALDNQTITIPVNITSVNVLGIYNTRTNEGFTTIQSAINSNDTLDWDTIKDIHL